MLNTGLSRCIAYESVRHPVPLGPGPPRLPDWSRPQCRGARANVAQSDPKPQVARGIVSTIKVEVNHPVRTSLGELALLFLKLGAIAFGGPAAHIAMMEDEVVRRHAWLSREAFLDLLGATNLIPGPNSTEMAIHIGHRKAGWAGLLVAGSCFILPAALLVTVIASVYVRYGALPEGAGVLYGVKPVIIAVVLQALWGLGRAALKTKVLAIVGAVGIAFASLGVNELIILFGSGLVVP